MLDFGFYNEDCMKGMKEFPDKYFDLAIVDPPYGDGGGEWSGREQFGERFDRYRLFAQLPAESRKTKTHVLGNGGGGHEDRRNMGREIRQKNHSVGHSPEAGIF